ncbi:MAG: hypothetical protein JW895_05425 [Thermoleophilaceae bacterium]|nr:hypothetical protein [Thermoleophilaceae bacterium]
MSSELITRALSCAAICLALLASFSSVSAAQAPPTARAGATSLVALPASNVLATCTPPAFFQPNPTTWSVIPTNVVIGRTDGAPPAAGHLLTVTVPSGMVPGQQIFIGWSGNTSCLSFNGWVYVTVTAAGPPPPAAGPCPNVAAGAERRREALLQRLRAEGAKARAQAREAAEVMKRNALSLDALDMWTWSANSLESVNTVAGFGSGRLAGWAATTRQPRDPKTGRFLAKNPFLKAGNYRAIEAQAKRFSNVIGRVVLPTELAKYMLASGFYAAALVEREANSREIDLFDAAAKIAAMSSGQFAQFESLACMARKAHAPAPVQPVGGWIVVDDRGRLVTGTNSAELLPQRWQQVAAQYLAPAATGARSAASAVPAAAGARPGPARRGARLVPMAELVVNLKQRTTAARKLGDCIATLAEATGTSRATRAAKCARLATQAAGLARRTATLRKAAASLFVDKALVPDRHFARGSAATRRRHARALRIVGADTRTRTTFARTNAKIGRVARTSFRSALTGSASRSLDRSAADSLTRTAAALNAIADG